MAIPVLSSQDFGNSSRINNLPASAANGQPLVNEQKGQLLTLPFSTTLSSTARTTAWIADHPSGAGAYTWDGTAWAAPAATANWASPGAIGSTTPNSGVFTQLAGSRTLLGLVPDGTILTKAAHVGRAIQINGGTIILPDDPDWVVGDEIEVLVAGTNSTTIDGNGAVISYYGGGPFPTVVMAGTVGTKATFKKMASDVVYAYTEAITLSGQNDVSITNPQVDDALVYNSSGKWANGSLPFGIGDRWMRAYIMPSNGTTIQTLGVTTAATGGGTVSNAQPDNTSTLNRAPRILFPTTGTAGNVSTLRCNNLRFYRGASSTQGGFRVVIPFGMTGIQAGQRAFFGISNAGAGATNVDPLTAVTTFAKIGLACNQNTGNWNLIHNATNATPTVIALNANFPVDITTWFTLQLTALPGAADIAYVITNKTTNQSTSGVLNTNLPPANLYMSPFCWATNNATAAVVTPGIGHIRMEYGE